MSGTDATATTSAADSGQSQPDSGGENTRSQVDSGEELSKWQSLSRQNETRWKQTTAQLDKAKQEIADRDVKIADLSTASAGEIAATKLELALARAGMSEEQAANYVQFLDRGRLLKDGKPDPDAIKQIAAAVPASLRSGPVDVDQGRSSATRPLNMNSLIRQSAGLNA